jgi:hypothetical protein
MAKENSGIDARQAFNMAIHQWMLRIMSKIEDAASRGDTCYYADVARSEVPMYKEMAKRLADKGYTTELKESDDLAHMEISWMLADEKEPDENRIKPIRELAPSDKEDRRLWSISQWHQKVKELNGMVSFLEDENTKMRNELGQVKIENTWLDRSAYSLPSGQVVVFTSKGNMYIGVMGDAGTFNIQYDIVPYTGGGWMREDSIIKWKRVVWPVKQG